MWKMSEILFMPKSKEAYGFHFIDLHKMYTYIHLSALGGYLLH
jgi:hypothetical protein